MSIKEVLFRKIAPFKEAVPLLVLSIYVFVVLVSPYVVSAQNILPELISASGSNNIYLTQQVNGQKYKRFIHKDAIGLYSGLSNIQVKTVSQNTLNSFATVEVVTRYPQGKNAVDEQGMPIPPELYRIRVDPVTGAQTIKRLVMNASSFSQSGYKHSPDIFEINEQEINFYNQGDSIYHTGTTNWESNIYRKTDTLRPEENGIRIYRTLIPAGENKCTVEGDVVAVIGKPGVNYVTVAQQRKTPLHPDLNSAKLYGGSVIIYIQATNFDNPTPTFTLECQQVPTLTEHTINTSTLPDPNITFTHSGTGEQSFGMTLPNGYHYCALKDNNGNFVAGSKLNLFVSATNNNSFYFEDVNVGNATYNIRVKTDNPNKPTYQGTWTVQCHTPQTITLQPNIPNRITGVGPNAFQLLWTEETKRVPCTTDHLSFFNPQGANFSTNALLPARTAFGYIRPSENSEWSTICQTQDTLPADISNSINYTPFVSGPKTECPAGTPNNPNLLCRVIERADGVRCANHLLGLDDIVGTMLLVPENLCIKYMSTNQFGVGGFYNNKKKTISIIAPGYVANREVFNDLEQRKQESFIHELCHAQQGYYENNIEFGPRAWNHLVPEFVAITGHEWNPDGDNSFGWYYPDTGKYYGMYGAGYGINLSNGASNKYDILETGSEFCTAFAIANAGRNDISRKMKLIKGVGLDEMLDKILNNKQAQEWIMGYMLNPNLEPHNTIDLSPTTPTNIQITNIHKPTQDSVSFDISWDGPSKSIPALTERQFVVSYGFEVRKYSTGPAVDATKQPQMSITNKQPNSATITIQHRQLEVYSWFNYEVIIKPKLTKSGYTVVSLYNESVWVRITQNGAQIQNER